MPLRTAQRGRRARHRLAGALVLVVLAQVAAGLLLDFRYPLLSFPAAREVVGRLASLPSGPDVVILGSSRFAGDFDEYELAAQLEGGCRSEQTVHVLNAAVPAGGTVAQERVLDYLFTAGARPRLLVAEVSPEFSNHYNFCYSTDVLRLLRWRDLPEHFRPLTEASQLGRYFTGLFVPVYYYRERFREEAATLCGISPSLGPLDVPQLSLGPLCHNGSARVPGQTLREVPLAGPPADLAERIRDDEHRVRTDWLRQFRIGQTQFSILRRTIRRCQEAGIEVWLVSAPVTAAHRALYTPEIEGPYQEMLAGVCAEQGCRHVDCRDWLPDYLFLDSHHVTPEGRFRFTRLLARREMVRWWQQTGLAQR